MKHDFTDYWSIPHFFAGFAIIYLNNRYFHIKDFWKIFIIGNLIHIIYEAKDYMLSYHPGVFQWAKHSFPILYEYDIIHDQHSITNIIGDQFYFIMGLLCAYRYQGYVNIGAGLYICSLVMGGIFHLECRG